MNFSDLKYILDEHFPDKTELINFIHTELIAPFVCDTENALDDLISMKDSIASWYELCPECGSALEVGHERSDSEYFGCPVTEKLSYHYCPVCGEVD